jgi:hypothetical protein
MSWRKVNVLKKAKVFEVNTDVPFNLANYTGGCPWGETVIDLGISSVEMGFNTIGLKTELTPLGGNWYKGVIYRVPLVMGNNYNEYTYSTANENGKGELIAGDTRNFGPNFGGVRYVVKTEGCNPETQIILRYRVSTYRNNIVDYTGSFTGNVMTTPIEYKTPPTFVEGTFTCATFEVRNSYQGYITFFIQNYVADFFQKVPGTLNVLALEV